MNAEDWIESEVLSYLEFKIQEEIATKEEHELYIDIRWHSSLAEHGETIDNLLEEMRDIFDNGYK